MIGETLAHYRIDERVGAGGMGEVYKAHDTKLKRTVAIKVLPQGAVFDSERRRRFIQEAQAASALDHPNIVTIHDISEAEGRHFIVMQYVEGKTLREWIGEMTLSKTLDIAIQMADGLAAAHAHGIVHRDLKPENTMVRDDGRVTLLDFGLAKLTEPVELDEAETRDKLTALTREGTIMGTAPYMSPEQAEGRPVDARSDIFSFGSILYEMVSGKRAFEGKSQLSVLHAVAYDEPKPLRDLVRSVPAELERVITRALRKEPERRFQSMAKVKVELDEIRDALASGGFVSARRTRTSRRWLWAASASGLALAAGVVVWYSFPSPEPDLPPPRTIPLTTYPGSENDPALSPDGKQVTFAWRKEDGTRHVYVKLVDGGEPLQLTTGLQEDRSPAWSPDGTRIAFLRDTEDGGQDILVVPALGGQPRRIGSKSAKPVTSDEGRGLSWSPDGRLLAVVDRASTREPNAIFLLSVDTGEKRKLTAPPAEPGDFLPAFSPDGRFVAFERRLSGLYVTPLDGDARLLTEGQQSIKGLDWSPDGRSIVFSSGREHPLGWASNLWRIGLDTDEQEAVMVSGEGAWSPSVSRQGHRLVYVTARGGDNDIWRFPGPASSIKRESGERFIHSTRNELAPAYSPDGARIAWISFRSGYQEVWVCDNDGSNPTQLTFLENGETFFPSWSPDGQLIAFSSPEEGKHDIYTVSSEGGPPQRLTAEASIDIVPRWSRDGRWIYFVSDRDAGWRLWKIPADGGEAFQVTEEGGYGAVESADGRFVYYSKQISHGQEGVPGIWRMPIDGGREERVLEHEVHLSWALLDNAILYVNRGGDTGTDIELFELDSGRTRRIASMERQANPWGISVSPDGTSILYAQESPFNLDLWLVENFY